MAKSLLLDEIHLSILIPSQLPMPDALAIRRTLKSIRFQSKLQRAIGDMLRQFPVLTKVRFTMSR